tara:strand:- start:38622 stop:39386 length:765 start_codon:yes stop_codon:yes gene_type:complete
MTQIIGFAGKKQSGKNTACDYVVALKLAELGISKSVRFSKSGKIEVSDIFGERKPNKDWFEFSNDNLNISKLFSDGLDKYVKVYGLADTLKDLCIKVLGLSYEQAYGSDKDKNSLTEIEWITAPCKNNKLEGKMTAREVLQYVGTDIFRRLDPDVWIKSLLRKIQKDSPEIALICDVRFKNEIIKLQEAGGYIVGLTRDPYKKGDAHSSEKEIEECIDLCDTVVDNRKSTIEEQLKLIHDSIKHIPNVIPATEN